ncbi:MAG: hypothetical protein RMN52_06185, partial [Anaerolineae bacterium]|nr:hypothetical protein [Candidatus Roseilinea sp.]MDW8449575.1 hypothetical protein [Anaerolineae bacterium]
MRLIFPRSINVFIAIALLVESQAHQGASIHLPLAWLKRSLSVDPAVSTRGPESSYEALTAGRLIVP